jgi:hypothetical protein
MTQWSIWGGFMKKTRGQKSRATVPLSSVQFRLNYMYVVVEKNATLKNPMY